MADERIQGYARGIFEMAKGERTLDRVESELLAVARAVETSNELRSTLTDPQLTLERKQAIVDELIGGRAAPLTISAIQMIVAQGRGSDLPEIAMSVATEAAASRNKAMAEIRSAVALDDETVTRLTASLAQATGKEIEVKVVVDPTVIGGIVARVGDTVIDGSLARRFDEARQAVKSR